MKKLLLAIALIIFPVSLWASNHKFNKKIISHELQEELISKGFNVDTITGLKDAHEIVWGPGGETKDPTAIIDAYIYIDPAIMAATRKASITMLVAKLRAKTITNLERDELLDKILQSMGY